jgi:serine/threonine protein phosphatase PrpC
MSLDLAFWAATDIGKKKPSNEDAYLVDKKLGVFVVADGMGGHAAGEVASQTAARKVREVLTEQRDVVELFATGEGDRKDVLMLLEHAVQNACDDIYQMAQADPGKRGMGTTLTMMLLTSGKEGARGFIAHVGDSRIYLLRDSQVHQLTEDHSLINELVRRGKIKSKEEIDSSPYKDYKHAMTRAVGVYATVEVDTLDFDVLPGDRFLICCDGLYTHVEDHELIGLLPGDVKEVPSKLIDLANERGGSDNITAVVVSVGEGSGETARDALASLNLRMEALKGMPLFRYLTYKELVRVMNICQSREVAPGVGIIGEGETGDELFVIVSGKVRLHKGGETITELAAGQHFGEMALVDNSPRMASAEAVEPSRMLAIRRKDFFDIIRDETGLSVKLLWSFVQVLTDRLRKTMNQSSGKGLPKDLLDLSEDVLMEEGADDDAASENLLMEPPLEMPTAGEGTGDIGDGGEGSMDSFDVDLEDSTRKLKVPV